MSNQYVKEAPYHPGYEDAVIIKPTYQEPEPLSKEITELYKFRDMYLNTAKKIVEFVKHEHSSNGNR